MKENLKNTNFLTTQAIRDEILNLPPIVLMSTVVEDVICVKEVGGLAVV